MCILLVKYWRFVNVFGDDISPPSLTCGLERRLTELLRGAFTGYAVEKTEEIPDQPATLPTASFGPAGPGSSP